MRRAHALPAAALALAAAALFAGAGSSDGRLFWIGAAAVVVASAAVVAGAALPAFALLLAAFVLWEAVSISWSIQPARSWDYANRGLVYLAFACVGAALAAVPPRRVAAALAALLGALFAVALAAKVIPALYDDYGRLARLRWPVGYWNQLALLADAAVPLGLWLSGRRDLGVRARAAGTLLVYAALVVAVLTFSRVGVVLALAAAALSIWLGAERRASVTAFAVAAMGATVASVVGLLLPGISDDGEPRSVRFDDGLLFGVVLVVAALAVAVLARATLAREEQRRYGERLMRAGAIAVAAVVVAALAAAVVRAGGPADFVRDRWHEFSNPVSAQIANTRGRLASASSSNRWRWWQEAWDAFTEHPLRGTGAGTFGLTDRLERDSPLATVEPHNTPLQFLSETGLVGFALYAGAIVAVALAFRRRNRDAATVALALVLLLGLVHSVVDIDWDYVASQGPLFALAGFVAAPPVRAVARVRRPLLAAAATIACLAALYSLLSPWLSDKRLDTAYDRVAHGDFAGAESAAKQAHSLNPLAVRPLFLLGALQQSAQPYRQATRREPKNPETWFSLAQFYAADGNWRRAYDAANHSYTLDRHGPAGQKGGLLDQARCKVDPSTCR